VRGQNPRGPLLDSPAPVDHPSPLLARQMRAPEPQPPQALTEDLLAACLHQAGPGSLRLSVMARVADGQALAGSVLIGPVLTGSVMTEPVMTGICHLICIFEFIRYLLFTNIAKNIRTMHNGRDELPTLATCKLGPGTLV
jgi:hypothetical protein